MSENFSILHLEMEKLKEQSSFNLLPIEPFENDTPAKKKKRISKALKDFWYFDSVYFPKEMYPEGHFEPNRMLKDMVKMTETPGIHVVFGARDHGKTVTAKKLYIWLLLNGVEIGGIYSETIPKAGNILDDIVLLMNINDRIVKDFDPVFIEDNRDQCKFTITINNKKAFRYLSVFSEGRSVRGFSRVFSRPSFMLADDVETLESSLSPDSVQNRVDKLLEAYHSLTGKASFIILANDFNAATALHRLRLQKEQGLLGSEWNFHIYPAWNSKRNVPLWQERYPAKSENELRIMLKVSSDSDWQGNYQQNPMPPEGFYFKKEYYQEYTTLPSDIRGVIYTDPNLSKKGMGDTTAIVALVVSIKAQAYYVIDARCQSYSDSNQLLEDVVHIKGKHQPRLIAIAFDGHVTQESTWTQFIRNYCRIHNVPYPVIEFKRYHTDDLAKNLQLIYNSKQLYFPPGFGKTKEGDRFLSQMFSFRGKKANKADDAPDALIGAFEFLHERHIPNSGNTTVKTFKDYYHL